MLIFLFTFLVRIGITEKMLHMQIVLIKLTEADLAITYFFLNQLKINKLKWTNC